MHLDDAAAEAIAALFDSSAGGRTTLPADQLLREFFRSHPGLGKRDRLRVADRVFDVLRNLRLYRELVRRARSGHSHVVAAAGGAAEGHETASVDVAAAQSLTDVQGITKDDAGELVAVAGALAVQLGGGPDAEGEGDHLRRMAAMLPDAIRFSLPDWLWKQLRDTHGEQAGVIAQSLLRPATVDLRVNLIRGKADALRRTLAERGIEALTVAGVPTCLRVRGRPNLETLDLFERGWFEIQDAGSQWIADACQARRGQLMIDFCAGAGGKALALAARMRNSGQVLAFDTGERRLARLMPRARRAGVDIISTMRISGTDDPRLARYYRRADVVLVDAPCSATGTLSRNPDLKWRLSPQQVRGHMLEQQKILACASRLVKPGGVFVYATCSLLGEENQQQVARFGQQGAGFTIPGTGDAPTAAKVSSAERRVSQGRAEFDLIRSDYWLPDGQHTSGFFVAKWVLRALQRHAPGTIPKW